MGMDKFLIVYQFIAKNFFEFKKGCLESER